MGDPWELESEKADPEAGRELEAWGLKQSENPAPGGWCFQGWTPWTAGLEGRRSGVYHLSLLGQTWRAAVGRGLGLRFLTASVPLVPP